MARCLRELGRTDEALEKYNAALKILPTLCWSRADRAAILFDRGDFSGAVRDLTVALEQGPEHPSFTYWQAARAAAYRAMGRDDLANRDLKTISEAHEALVEQLISVGGGFVYGALVQANSKLLEPGPEDLPCLVVISFDPTLSSDPSMLCRIARLLGTLKDTHQSDPDLALMASYTTHEGAVMGRRRRISPRLTRGTVAYAADLMVRRHLLQQGFLADPVLPCVAEPGERGRIELLPYDAVPAQR